MSNSNPTRGLENIGFFAYRLPGKKNIVSMSGRCNNGLNDNSFIIAPFIIDNENIISISADKEASLSDFDNISQKSESTSELFPIIYESTSEVEHSREIAGIKAELGNNELHKTVACRIISGNERINGTETFLRLCDAFPSAFIFLIHTPMTGSWVGASPELLLKCSKQSLSTFALAGTRRVTCEKNKWNHKNILEQRIVSDYIADIFEKWEMPVDIKGPITRKAGNVEHLLSEINTPVISPKFSENQIQFLRQLSPTPALCGFPKEKSIGIISKYENFRRGYYGGFIGFRSDDSNFIYYVNLRSIHFNVDSWNMIVGGGITCNSDPKDEWHETCIKSDGVLSCKVVNE